ncbi:MAG: OadG family protein [Dysgonamonadaceae bacterium]|jgi:Na+-transporting methylmalonyl-CoA/oxaloacetate decarboxylase gamma subunit|nr:OadG family protein [Dysgonamonadaceae bacterium]
MKRTAIFVTFFLLATCSYLAEAQSTTAMKLNEILVVNEDNFVDDYGQRNGWVELFNNSPATVNIAGCYLTDDKNNPKKYMIPKGDMKTQIKPRQHVLFWADDKASRGTFHLNFELDKEKENYIGFYNTDGLTLIDEVVVPVGQKADVSYGLDLDGTGKWLTLTKVTPDTNNKTLDTNDKIENFQHNDSRGFGMTIAAMFVVFAGLMLLFLMFKLVGKIATNMSKRRALQAKGMTAAATGENLGEEEDVSGEVIAAISAALYQIENDAHDWENTILTIRNITRNYSPWSSKIHILRHLPRK